MEERNFSKKVEQESSKEVATTKRHLGDLILVTEWTKYYDYPTLGMLRKLIFNADHNGFNKVIRRIGNRVLIKVSAFEEWIEEDNGFGTSQSKTAPTQHNFGGIYND